MDRAWEHFASLGDDVALAVNIADAFEDLVIRNRCHTSQL